MSTAKDVKVKIEARWPLPLKLDLAASPRKSRRRRHGQGAFADDNRACRRYGRPPGALIDLELHAHLSRPLHLAALAADEGGGVLAELAEIPQIGGQHGMRVAADRILRDAERGAEHARFGRQFVRVSIEGEDEETFGAEFSAERQQSVEIRRESVQLPGIRDRHQQPAAALAGDSRRHDLVQLGGRQTQRFGDAQRGLERQRSVEFGHRSDEIL